MFCNDVVCARMFDVRMPRGQSAKEPLHFYTTVLYDTVNSKTVYLIVIILLQVVWDTGACPSCSGCEAGYQLTAELILRPTQTEKHSHLQAFTIDPLDAPIHVCLFVI